MRTAAHGKGFSLIEAMVGIAVGMITVLIISQTFVTFESSKQTTTAGADAQENGLLAVNAIEQDIRSAGAGLAEISLHECANLFTSFDPDGAGPTPAGPIGGFSTAPLTITDGGANGSDTIVARQGVFLGSVPAYLDANLTPPYGTNALVVDRNADVGYADDDLVLISDGASCALLQIEVDAGLPKVLSLKASSSYNGDTSTWPTYNAQAAKVFNVGKGDGTGPGLAARTYSVDGNRNLQVTVGQLGAATTTQTLVRNVVSLQARYGVTAGGTGNEAVDRWCPAVASAVCTANPDGTGGTVATENWNSPTAAQIRRIKAVHIAVVTRSEKRETTTVTTTAPAPGVSTLADWQNYRYKTYTTTIPLRNMLWPNIT
jgi:type IV pilus assembly protein PilW